MKEGADLGALSFAMGGLEPARAETVGWLRPLPDGRVFLCLASEEVILTNCGRPARLTMPAADLSLLASGRAPLLIDHLGALEFLAGVVEEAWIEAGQLYAHARLARTSRMGEVRALVADGILRNCSVASLVSLSASPDLQGVHSVTSWRPFEASLATVPRGWVERRR